MGISIPQSTGPARMEVEEQKDRMVMAAGAKPGRGAGGSSL